MLYEDAEYHSCVFIGTDEGGDPRHTFHHIGTDGSLFVFEAPIDMLSYITLYPDHWQEHSYVACCGVSFQPVEKMLERMPRVESVFLCLDNDHAGHKASKRMAEALAEKNIPSERLLSERKDWNEDLKMEVSQCQRMCGP